MLTALHQPYGLAPHRIKVAESRKNLDCCSDILLLPRPEQTKVKVIDKRRPQIFSLDFKERPCAEPSDQQSSDQLHASEVDDHVRRTDDGVVLVERDAEVRIAIGEIVQRRHPSEIQLD